MERKGWREEGGRRAGKKGGRGKKGKGHGVTVCFSHNKEATRSANYSATHTYIEWDELDLVNNNRFAKNHNPTGTCMSSSGVPMDGDGS